MKRYYTGAYTALLMIIAILSYSLFHNREVINKVAVTNLEPEIEVITPIEETKEHESIIEEQVQEVSVPVEEPQQKVEVYQAPEKESSNTLTYKITHYGPDCSGCSGTTASGYNVSNTIYYNDATYGQVRVVATSREIPLYSIIKLYNYKLGGDITAIVLDRGVGSGIIDLLVESEAQASQFGIQRGVQIEILRSGR